MASEVKKGPGKHYRQQGMTTFQVLKLFPDEKSARAWFAMTRWPGGPVCPRCEGEDVQYPTNHPTMDYRCRGCQKFFSVRLGTAVQNSKLPCRAWAVAIYMMSNSLKGVSSIKLHRELGITQRSAWFLLHRIRTAWEAHAALTEGPVEADETYIGGRDKNRHARERKPSRGGDNKTAVIGARDRKNGKVAAFHVPSANRQAAHKIITDHVDKDATLYTDESQIYDFTPDVKREAIHHSARKYVREQAHTNGIESFGTRYYERSSPHLSSKHLALCVGKFTDRHNIREEDTISQTAMVDIRLTDKNLSYKGLTG